MKRLIGSGFDRLLLVCMVCKLEVNDVVEDDDEEVEDVDEDEDCSLGDREALDCVAATRDELLSDISIELVVILDSLLLLLLLLLFTKSGSFVCEKLDWSLLAGES